MVLQEGGQRVAPTCEVAVRGRVVVPEFARQGREVLVADQGGDDGEGGVQRTLGQRVAVGLVGHEATAGVGGEQRVQRLARLRRCPAARALEQRGQQGLLLQGQRIHANNASQASSACACRRAVAASSSSTDRSGTSVSHSISVGTAPKRRSAWR
eukprot:Opistho-1_new@90646